MKMIIYSSESWKWLERLRIGQADLYYFIVKHVGDHAYAVDKNNKKINLM